MWLTLWKFLNPFCSHFVFTQQNYSHCLSVQLVHWQLHMQDLAYRKANVTGSPWDLPSERPKAQSSCAEARRAACLCRSVFSAFGPSWVLILASFSWWFSEKLCLCWVYIAIKFAQLLLSLPLPSLVINQDCTVVDSFLFSFPPFWSE